MSSLLISRIEKKVGHQELSRILEQVWYSSSKRQ